MIFNYILGTVRAILMLLITAIYLVVYLGTSIIFKRTQKRDFRLRRNFLRIINPLLGVSVEVTGKPVDGPALYVSNHRSFIDPFVVSPYVEVFFIAKAEVGKMPILSIGFDVTGVILVDRESKDSRSNTRVQLVEKIKNGHNVLIYAEGTTGVYQQTKPFKMGAFSEASKHGFQIVPVSIEYKKQKDRWESGPIGRQYFRQIGRLRTQAKLHFGTPIKSDDRRVLSSGTKEEINKNLTILQENFSEPFIPAPEEQTS